MPAPPPMRFVSRSESAQLLATRDSKSRLRATIDLAENRLTQAENFTAQKKFDEASEEIGSYLGLIDDLRTFIASLNRDKSSTRDLYRHMEIAVRAHIPRLAVMRRTTPVSYAVNIKDAEEYIKEARAEALDSFYGHTVLRDVPTPQKKPEQSNNPPDGIKHP